MLNNIQKILNDSLTHFEIARVQHSLTVYPKVCVHLKAR